MAEHICVIALAVQGYRVVRMALDNRKGSYLVVVAHRPVSQLDISGKRRLPNRIAAVGVGETGCLAAHNEVPVFSGIQKTT